LLFDLLVAIEIENFGGANNGRHLALDMGTVCCAPLPRPANRPSSQPPSPANIGQHQQQQVKVNHHLTNKTTTKSKIYRNASDAIYRR
jgi:hypothetical protein